MGEWVWNAEEFSRIWSHVIFVKMVTYHIIYHLCIAESFWSYFYVPVGLFSATNDTLSRFLITKTRHSGFHLHRSPLGSRWLVSWLLVLISLLTAAQNKPMVRHDQLHHQNTRTDLISCSLRACWTQKWGNAKRTPRELRQFHEHHAAGSLSNESGWCPILEVEGMLHSREHGSSRFFLSPYREELRGCVLA